MSRNLTFYERMTSQNESGCAQWKNYFPFLSSGKPPFYYHVSFKVNNIDYDSKFAKPYSQEYMDLNKKIVSLVS